MNNQEIQQLKDQVTQLTQQLSDFKSFFNSHFHNGNDSQRVNLQDIFGTFDSMTSAPTIVPIGVFDQFKVVLSGGIYKLYVYDITNGIWKSVTIT